MKFFHALIILATSGGVATAKDSSRASASDLNRKQERDHKRFLRIKQAESARRSLAQPMCVDGTGDCCIGVKDGTPGVGSSVGSKAGKTGRILDGADFTELGCARVCVPLCATENEDQGNPTPPATCVDPESPTGACP